MTSPPPFPEPGTLKAKIVNRMISINTVLYRATNGRLGGTVGGGPVLLLDHVGRKSGKARTAPLIYTRDGDKLVIVASRGGSEAMPAWWANLKASPGTTVQVKGDKIDVVAREAEGDERERLWPKVVETYAEYDVYQARTSRVIPVIVLEPVSRRPG